MIELLFFPSPNGIKIAIMLEECELPYRITRIDITAGAQFDDEFTRISPNCKIPALIDHTAEPALELFESGAILLYLAKKTGRFFPGNDRQYHQALPWLFWQIGHLGPMAGQAHYFRKFCEIKDSHGIERFTNEMHRLYTVMEKHLNNTEFMLDEYSIVDMACWPWVKYHEWQGQDLSDFPRVKTWFETIEQRPAVIRAVSHGTAEQVSRESYREVLHNQTGANVDKFSNNND